MEKSPNPILMYFLIPIAPKYCFNRIGHFLNESKLFFLKSVLFSVVPFIILVYFDPSIGDTEKFFNHNGDWSIIIKFGSILTPYTLLSLLPSTLFVFIISKVIKSGASFLESWGTLFYIDVTAIIYFFALLIISEKLNLEPGYFFFILAVMFIWINFVFIRAFQSIYSCGVFTSIVLGNIAVFLSYYLSTFISK